MVLAIIFEMMYTGTTALPAAPATVHALRVSTAAPTRRVARHAREASTKDRARKADAARAREATTVPQDPRATTHVQRGQ